jgi:hypothetical protein
MHDWAHDILLPPLWHSHKKEPAPKLEKRHVSAYELLQDIHAGLDDVALMVKYRLSARDFMVLCAKLIETGRLTEVELSELHLLWAQKQGRVWRCPACHMPQSHEYAECPQCGIIVAKYALRHPKEALQTEDDHFMEVPPADPEEDLPESTVRPAPDDQVPALRCSVCGKALSEEAKFCASCGTRVAH